MGAVAGRQSPWFGLLVHPNPPLCGESVTGNLHNASTPAPGPSPVVLPMLFMVNAAGLAIRRGSVVLCRFWNGCDRPAPLPFLSAVYQADGPRAPPNRARKPHPKTGARMRAPYDPLAGYFPRINGLD